MAAERVLLVDDEVEFIEALAERLRTRGLVVEIATSGPEGIEIAKQGVFDAIVLDFAMPGLNGIETLKALHDHNPDLQVMLLTGQATVSTAVEATKEGAVDVLEKPTDVNTLVDKIRSSRAKHLSIRDERTQEQAEEIMRKYGW